MARYTKDGFLLRISQRLRALGISENKASEMAGFSRTYIKELRRDDIKSPTWDKVQKLAEALDCDPAWLLTGIEPTITDPRKAELLDITGVISEARLAALLETARSMALAESAEVPIPAPKRKAEG